MTVSFIMRLFLTWFILYSFSTNNFALTNNLGHLHTLVKDLFQGNPTYSKNVRSVRNWRTVTNVTLNFGINQLYAVQGVERVVQTVCYLEMKWKDEYLTWDPDDYDGITSFRYPYREVWSPEIMLFNTPDLNDKPIEQIRSTNVVIDNDGNMFNSYIALFKATCPDMDMTYFPFDYHKCFFRFGSWTYSKDEIQLIWEPSTSATLSKVSHSEWDYELVDTKISEVGECCPNATYTFIDIYVQLNRKSLYYLFNLILPTIIICFVAMVGMFSPTSSSGERTEKVHLGMATLLSISILMLTVSQTLPVSSDHVNIMSWFLQSYIIIISLATLTTVIVISIDSQGVHKTPVPCWAKRHIIDRFGPYLFVSRFPSKKQIEKPKTKPNLVHTKSLGLTTRSVSVSTVQTSISGESDGEDRPLNLSIMFEKIVRMANFVEDLSADLQYKDQLQEIRTQWSVLATIVERLFLIGFLIFGGCVASFLLLIRSHGRNH